MKIIFLILTLFICKYGYGQTDINDKIDTSNYYSYYASKKNIKGDKLTTNWLRLNDVVPIIMEELKKAGYEWVYDYKLFKVRTGEYIVLAAYSRKSNFGFLYIEGHDMYPSKEHREYLSQDNLLGINYTSCEETPSGEPNFINIKKLPENVFVLNENCYWYQYSNNSEDNKSLLTKETAIKLLKMDIAKYLTKVKVVK